MQWLLSVPGIEHYSSLYMYIIYHSRVIMYDSFHFFSYTSEILTRNFHKKKEKKLRFWHRCRGYGGFITVITNYTAELGCTSST